MDPADRRYEELKMKWVDKYVTVNADCPELKRFADKVGRVITVNRNGKAIIDFDDGAWYDIAASEDFLKVVDSDDEKKKYKGTINSAQVIPAKQ